jgi:arsenate reductase-like glutaredoxin family protein
MYIKIIGDRGRKSVNKCINLCNSDGIPFKLYSPKKQQLTRELLKELLEKSNNGINDFISRNVSVYIRAKINKMSVNQALDYVINNNKIMRTIIIG